MAYLEFQTGPLARTVVPLSAERETVLGRDGSCTIVVPAQSVSRRHARIHAVNGEFVLDDLESVNGTFVNSLRVTTGRPLKDGDKIHLYNVIAVFHHGECPPAPVGDLPKGDSALRLSETLVVPGDTAPEFKAYQPELLLRSITEIIHRMGSSLDVEKLLPNVLDILFDGLPHVASGQILLLNEAGQLMPRATKRTRESDSAVFEVRPIDDAIALHVVNRGEIAVVDAGDSEWAVDEGVPASITAPIAGPDRRVLGVIQLQSEGTSQPFDQSQVNLVSAVCALAGQAIGYGAMHRQRLEVDRRQHELELAHEVQLRMLPRLRPEVAGYDLCDFYKAAFEVGGDFFGYFPTLDGCLVITIGDVCGKGVSAALAMAEFAAETRHAVTESGSIKRVMARLNAFAFQHKLLFLPFVLAHLDPRRHIVTIANAGQLPPLCGRAESARVEPLKVPRRGFPFGVVPDQEFHPAPFELRPGDVLLLYTDGATEAMNPQGELFGAQRLHAAFEASLGLPAAAAVSTVTEEIGRFCSSGSQRDDLCLVCLRRTDGLPAA